MTWETILKAVIVALSTFVTTGVPLIIAFVNAIKKRKAAQTEAEKTAANNEMLKVANDFIEYAEDAYKSVDKVLKSDGGSAGAIKKESVMTKLQAYAMNKGYEFDSDFWNAKVDELVAFTRKVNSK